MCLRRSLRYLHWLRGDYIDTARDACFPGITPSFVAITPMKAIRALLLAPLAFAFSACIVNIDDGHHGDDLHERGTIRGSGVRGNDLRTLRAFDDVYLNAPGDLIILFGDEETIEVEADDNLLPYFETDVRGERLQIDVADHVELRPERPVRFYLTVRDLDAVSILGAGDVEMDGFSGSTFALSISGSGNARFEDMHVTSLSVSVAGSGDILVSGSAENLDASLAGSGGLDAEAFPTNRVDISVLGSGSSLLRIRDELNVTIAGSGSVRFYGDPAIHSTILGTGRLVRLRD